MSFNSGAKDENDSAVSSADMTWQVGDLVPQVANTSGNPGPTRNLRGVEANTDESKGSACSVPPATIPSHEDGHQVGTATLEESY